ncbi:hypothetical protein KY290_034058 [Solanum tuberosum]|uniref:DDE Tnp4 domain-containing protein n=1 Tax=Solanum tuberosum TaxID=4113 RepID=A0ABQ7U2L4_SOLTU|nr:hypothetical protein KY289_033445 [Solanum tuberosum]KAH0741015.1 hypothetical protein KY290_034058 [Solanum tuberosum]
MPLILELDLDDEWTMQTVDLLVDKRNAEFFAAMPPELRKKWVMRKLDDMKTRGLLTDSRMAGKDISHEISSNPFFYPWFKDCVGAIDGTHIPALIPMEEQPRYRNRKGVLSQNVLAVVDFDMKFQYVLSGCVTTREHPQVVTRRTRPRRGSYTSHIVIHCIQ